MWTKDIPTEPGFYWYKNGDDESVVLVGSGGFYMTAIGTWFTQRHVDSDGGEFYSERLVPPCK